MKNNKELLKQKLNHVLPSIVAMPYYRKKYNIEHLTANDAMDFIVNNFYELPILTRNEVPELTGVFGNDGSYSRLVMTGGTCGVSNVVEWKDEDLAIMSAPFEKRFRELGILPGDFVFSTVPVSMSIYGIGLEQICRDCGLSHIEIERISSSDYEIAQILLKRYKPKLFFGTAAGIFEMLEDPQMQEALQCLEVTVIGGAITSDKDISIIEKSINCKVIDLIGSTELSIFGIKEMGCSGFHLSTNSVEMELIEKDERGNGKCIMTSLCNKRMPLVRYMTGDVGHLSNSCTCGYEGLVFTITGRIADTCYIGGTKVDSDCFEYVAKALGFNTTFQALIFPKEHPKRILLNIVDTPAPWDTKKVIDALVNINVALRSKIASGMVKFEIGFIKEEELIGLNARGKWRRVLYSEK